MKGIEKKKVEERKGGGGGGGGIGIAVEKRTVLILPIMVV